MSNIFDVKGFGDDGYEKFESKSKDESQVFKPNNFDRSIVEDVSPIIKYEVINKRFSLEKLLKGAGYDTSGGVMYCPFHPDALTGKPSAKYHSDSDLLYCFSESKMYSAYHALKLIYGRDMNEVFNSVWSDMSRDEKEDILSKYDDGTEDVVTEESKSVWDEYIPILSNFKDHKITYTQFKNGLYRTILKVRESEGIDDDEQ